MVSLPVGASSSFQVMDGKNWLKVAIFLCLIAVSTGREFKVKAKNKHHAAIYNHTLAKILVEYASAVYVSDLTELFAWTCSRCNDLTKGFQILELIVDVQRCLQAFVGVAQDLNAIVIAFRGTQESRYFAGQLSGCKLDIHIPCKFVMLKMRTGSKPPFTMLWIHTPMEVYN